MEIGLSRALQVIGTDTDRSGTYDFLLVIRGNHGNHRPILTPLSRYGEVLAENCDFSYRRIQRPRSGGFS